MVATDQSDAIRIANLKQKLIEDRAGRKASASGIRIPDEEEEEADGESGLSDNLP